MASSPNSVNRQISKLSPMDFRKHKNTDFPTQVISMCGKRKKWRRNGRRSVLSPKLNFPTN